MGVSRGPLDMVSWAKWFRYRVANKRLAAKIRRKFSHPAPTRDE